MGSVKGYMGIIYAGLIVTAAYNSLAAFLRALGDSKSPLYFLIISAAINVVLDIAFIVKGGMGVEGCAYATVIAQAISAICCLVFIIKKFPILHLKKADFEISLTSFRYLLALGIPMGLTVFHHSHRNYHCAGSGKYLWICIYGRIFWQQERSRISLQRYLWLLERLPRLMWDRIAVQEEWIVYMKVCVTPRS